MSFGFSSHSGNAPSPFDRLNGGRLAGGRGSHPLHAVAIEELLRTTDGSLGGGIVIDGPVRVGEPIRGRIDLIANHDIDAGAANLRLVGLRLVEEDRSRSEGTGSNSRTEYWVECHGRLFSTSPFLEPVIPTRLASGEMFLATLVPIAQNPDLIAAGVGRQGGRSMLSTIDVGGATISVASPLPAAPGSALDVIVSWPGAPAGDVRVELHRRSNAPNGVSAVMAMWNLTGEELAAGNARASLRLPQDLAPSFDGADLRLDYVIRVLVDRRFMPDTAIERPVAIA